VKYDKSGLPLWVNLTFLGVLLLCMILMLGSDIANYINLKNNKSRTQAIVTPTAVSVEMKNYSIPIEILSEEKAKPLISSSVTVNDPVNQNAKYVVLNNIHPKNKQLEKTSFVDKKPKLSVNSQKKTPETEVDDYINDESKEKGNSEKWLQSQSRENYSLQLGSFSTVAKMNAYIEQLDFLNRGDFHKFKSIGDIYYVLYGSYKVLPDARKDQEKIPSGENIWVRKIGVLRDNRCRNRGLELNHPEC